MSDDVEAVLFLNDLHCGDGLGLAQPGTPITLMNGTKLMTGDLQEKMWAHWTYVRDVWLPASLRGAQRLAVVVNGDAMQGKCPKFTNVVSTLSTDQLNIAEMVLAPYRERVFGDNFFLVRGTEVHSGSNGDTEEELGRRLHARQSKGGRYSRYVLKLRLQDVLINVMHSVGTSTSAAYVTSALQRAVTRILVNCAAWKLEVPKFVVRAHAHYHVETGIPGEGGPICGVIVPGWQAKTPFDRGKRGDESPIQLGATLITKGLENKWCALTYAVKVEEDEVEVLA